MKTGGREEREGHQQGHGARRPAHQARGIMRGQRI